MKNYLRLTKTLLVTFFRPDKQQGKERTVSYVILGILGAVFSALIAVMFAFAGPILKDMGVVAEAATLLMDVGFILVLVFGTIGIFSYVYFAKDSEFLFSLPVKNSTVYISKLTIVYFQELLISTIIMLPGLVSLGIATGQTPLFYLMTLLAVTLVPVCPLFVSSLIAIPMMTVASFFKNKGAVSAVLLILLFAVVMTIYMVIVFNAQTNVGGESPTLEEMIAMMQTSMGAMARAIFPLFCLARFGTLTVGFVQNLGASAVIDLALFLGTVAAGAVITILISGAVYARSVLKQNEHTGGTSASDKTYVQGSALKALVKKEWRELVRNTSFAFQCLAGVIITPVFAVILPLMMGGSMSDTNTGPEFLLTWLITLLLVQMMSASMNQAATTAITREGVSFAYSKSMPVPYRTQIFAKLIVCDAIALVSAVLGIIAMTVTIAIMLGYVDVLTVILSLIFIVLYCLLYTNMCVLHDLKKPRLDWVTPREAVKGNVSLIVPTLLGCLATIISIVAIGFLAGLFTYLFDMQTVGTLIGFTVMIIIAAIVLVFSGYSLKNQAEGLYARLTV